jgi:tellurite resistance protein
MNNKKIHYCGWKTGGISALILAGVAALIYACVSLADYVGAREIAEKEKSMQAYERERRLHVAERDIQQLYESVIELREEVRKGRKRK